MTDKTTIDFQRWDHYLIGTMFITGMIKGIFVVPIFFSDSSMGFISKAIFICLGIILLGFLASIAGYVSLVICTHIGKHVDNALSCINRLVFRAPSKN